MANAAAGMIDALEVSPMTDEQDLAAKLTNNGQQFHFLPEKHASVSS